MLPLADTLDAVTHHLFLLSYPVQLATGSFILVKPSSLEGDSGQ